MTKNVTADPAANGTRPPWTASTPSLQKPARRTMESISLLLRTAVSASRERANMTRPNTGACPTRPRSDTNILLTRLQPPLNSSALQVRRKWVASASGLINRLTVRMHRMVSTGARSPSPASADREPTGTPTSKCVSNLAQLARGLTEKLCNAPGPKTL